MNYKIGVLVALKTDQEIAPLIEFKNSDLIWNKLSWKTDIPEIKNAYDIYLIDPNEEVKTGDFFIHSQPNGLYYKSPPEYTSLNKCKDVDKKGNYIGSNGGVYIKNIAGINKVIASTKKDLNLPLLYPSETRYFEFYQKLYIDIKFFIKNDLVFLTTKD